jgi:hypothetical protein
LHQVGAGADVHTSLGAIKLDVSDLGHAGLRR